MKTLLSLLLVVFGIQSLNAQTWTEPAVPGKDLNSLSSSEIVYTYNVEADAFLLYGMDWNRNACATRLTNGDKVVSIPQQCYAIVSNGTVGIRVKEFSGSHVSCLSEDANNIYVDQNSNYSFTYTETAQGSRIYTLNNTTYKKNLDVSWEYGGHLTITDGAGHTKWAFISETDITNGSYALYKTKKQLYDVYKAVCNAGKQTQYSEALATAYAAYTANNATDASIISAARTLFETVHADIEGPLNVSFLFDNPDMVGAANTSDWSVNSHGIAWGEFEVYHAAVTLSQTQTVPQGIYDVVFHALYRQDGSDAAPVLKVEASNTVTAEVPLMGTIDYKVYNTYNKNTWADGISQLQPAGMRSCSQALAHTDAVVRAENIAMMAKGEMTISAQVNSSTQWFNWQGFEIIYWGVGNSAAKGELYQNIELAERLYGDGSWNGAADMLTAINNAKDVYNNENSTIAQLTNANNTLSAEIEERKAMASTSQPFDWTELIQNPSFENRFDGWTQSGLALQGNTAFTLKDSLTYIEKWVGRGGHVGDASVTQTIKNLGMGVYVLKVSAHNIQENNSSANQSNAWLTANTYKTEVTTTKEHSLMFTNIENDATIGFKAVGATGNWLACDNFRLYYVGGTDADYKAALQAYYDAAETIAGKKMHTAAKETLEATMAAALAELGKTSTKGYVNVSTPLREAMEEADRSITAYAELLAAIEKAETQYGNGTGNGAADYFAAINAAKAAYADGATTYDDLANHIVLLDEAAFAFMLESPSGAIPTITSTDKRYARGSVMAFGRFTYNLNGAELREAGFCYSTEKNPTVLDQRSTRYIDSYGLVYVMQDMNPATVYYARPYVITKGYQVAYGDQLKIITLPKANIGWSWNYGGSAEENERISNAMRYGIEDIWGKLMSTQGFHLSGNYGSGTPTADCSYGGWMRVGPSESYQRTGTILHEAAHGVGVGTHWTWSTILVNGSWTGPRANSFLQFWENSTTATMAGDSQHMWPYGINGAHEDYGTEQQYFAQAMILQGMHEDGLSPTDGCFALPAYAFEHDDEVKYYIKNESESFGLTTSYLTVDGTSLKWREATSADVAADDNFAWYLSFDPATQYYSFRNAATGKYITYSNSSFLTTTKSTPAATEKFHVMKGRKDIQVGSGASATNVRGYWIMNVTSNNPRAMVATSSGNVGETGFDLSADAAAQHWVILTAEEATKFDEAVRSSELNELKAIIANIESTVATPHIERAEGADETVNAALASAKSVANNAASTLETIRSTISSIRQAGMDFLADAVPADVNNPFDLTFLVANASINDNTGWSVQPAFSNSCAEFYQTTFDFNQTLTGMPAGTYKLTAQAFQRLGNATASYNNFVAGNNNISTKLYINSYQQPVKNIASETETTSIHAEDAAVGDPAVYIPNTMASAAAHFAKGKYSNEVYGTLASEGDLTLGIKCDRSEGSYWSIFDNFRLYYYGVPELVLDEKATVAPDINRTLDEVTLKRTIKPNTWSTFVAPFDIPASSLSGWEIKELTGSELKGNTISLTFSNAQDGIKCGVPYMVRNTQISSPLTEITVYDVAVSTTFKHAETDHVVFTGVYHNGYVPEGAYFISSNTFYLAIDNTNTMKGYRAYIMPKPSVANANEIKLRWDDETAIQDIGENGDVTIKAIYNANGIPLREPQRGINILKMSDGTTRKVIVK